MEAHSPHVVVHCNENHLFAFKQLQQADKKLSVEIPLILKRGEGMDKYLLQGMTVSFCYQL